MSEGSGVGGSAESGEGHMPTGRICAATGGPRHAAIDRRAFISSLALGVLSVPTAAGAQPPAKFHRVGILWPGPPIPEGGGDNGKAWPRSFRQALQERGYVEGQNIAFEYRPAEGREDRLRDLADELTRLNVDARATQVLE